MNRIKQISNLINKCECVYDVGSDHALLAINILKDKKVKKVVNIEKKWQPHNIGKENLAKNHLTTKTINVLNDGLKDIVKRVFLQPDYIVIAGMGGNNIVEILNTRDKKIKDSTKYIFEANSNVHLLRKYLIKEKWEICFEDVCYDRSKFYQIICAKPNGKSKKLNTFEMYFGQCSKQKDKNTWLDYIKSVKKDIEIKKLNKISPLYSGLYKSIKGKINEN